MKNNEVANGQNKKFIFYAMCTNMIKNPIIQHHLTQWLTET